VNGVKNESLLVRENGQPLLPDKRHIRGGGRARHQTERQNNSCPHVRIYAGVPACDQETLLLLFPRIVGPKVTGEEGRKVGLNCVTRNEENLAFMGGGVKKPTKWLSNSFCLFSIRQDSGCLEEGEMTGGMGEEKKPACRGRSCETT